MQLLKLSARSFQLLEELELNNNRGWYQAHKNEFESELRTPFAEILIAASEALAGTKMPMRGSEKTMFRQNKDVRFSSNKLPYQTHISGVLTPSGSKTQDESLIYLQLQKDGGFLACGRYKMDARSLEPIRTKIIEDVDAFDAVLEDLDAAQVNFMEEGKLKAMPRGFESVSEHRHATYLKLVSYCISRDLPMEKWLEGEVVREITTFACLCESLLEFLNV
jgi:uncharacterized protein (TIGR02453 family)